MKYGISEFYMKLTHGDCSYETYLGITLDERVKTVKKIVPNDIAVEIPLTHQSMDPLHKEPRHAGITATLTSSNPNLQLFSALAFKVLWNCSIAIHILEACS
jgi:hypothetical protein